ncbi:hypothetical protein [[Mycoplasma] gypis]|uniref:Uncharacterized protein n=1 Tax=[Mycoplasma] gypis TaxID=92404 RepID=A0ABZ2RNW0_9BACT|nr:hypothetical protein [[Mycoplasma] gypis]MBN0919239.1 hypothetical protein [[Mycoplasma] gypis]
MKNKKFLWILSPLPFLAVAPMIAMSNEIQEDAAKYPNLTIPQLELAKSQKWSADDKKQLNDLMSKVDKNLRVAESLTKGVPFALISTLSASQYTNLAKSLEEALKVLGQLSQYNHDTYEQEVQNNTVPEDNSYSINAMKLSAIYQAISDYKNEAQNPNSVINHYAKLIESKASFIPKYILDGVSKASNVKGWLSDKETNAQTLKDFENSLNAFMGYVDIYDSVNSALKSIEDENIFDINFNIQEQKIKAYFEQLKAIQNKNDFNLATENFKYFKANNLEVNKLQMNAWYSKLADYRNLVEGKISAKYSWMNNDDSLSTKDLRLINWIFTYIEQDLPKTNTSDEEDTDDQQPNKQDAAQSQEQQKQNIQTTYPFLNFKQVDGAIENSSTQEDLNSLNEAMKQLSETLNNVSGVSSSLEYLLNSEKESAFDQAYKKAKVLVESKTNDKFNELTSTETQEVKESLLNSLNASINDVNALKSQLESAKNDLSQNDDINTVIAKINDSSFTASTPKYFQDKFTVNNLKSLNPQQKQELLQEFKEFNDEKEVINNLSNFVTNPDIAGLINDEQKQKLDSLVSEYLNPENTKNPNNLENKEFINNLNQELKNNLVNSWKQKINDKYDLSNLSPELNLEKEKLFNKDFASENPNQINNDFTTFASKLSPKPSQPTAQPTENQPTPSRPVKTKEDTKNKSDFRKEYRTLIIVLVALLSLGVVVAIIWLALLLKRMKK